MSTAWYLRSDRGVIFGPARIDVLREWAEQGRIGPESQLSTDHEAWVAAHTLPELEMDWMVDAGTGMIGPVNLRALRDLILEGTVPSTAVLVHRRSRSKQPLHQKMADIFDPPSSLPQPASPRGDASIPREALDRIAHLESQMKEASAHNQATTAELHRLQGALEQERRARESQQKESDAALQQAEAARLATEATATAEMRKATDYRLSLDNANDVAKQAQAELATAHHLLHQSQEAFAEQERRWLSTEEQSQVALAELRATLQSTQADLSKTRDSAAEQILNHASATEQWQRTERELREALKVAHDERTLARTAAVELASKHAADAEEWHRGQAQLHETLQSLRTELTACKDEAARKDRQHLAARDEWKLTHANMLDALQATRTLHETELATARECLSNATREAEQRDNNHLKAIAKLTAEQQTLQAAAAGANALLVGVRQQLDADRMLAAQREENLSHQLALARHQEEMLQTKLRQSENESGGQREEAHPAPRPANTIPTTSAQQQPEPSAPDPQPEQPLLTEEGSRVHEPEVLPPSSETERPPAHDREPSRISSKTSKEGSWSKVFGRRSPTEKDRATPDATLADIEAQARRDILAWQKGKSTQNRAKRAAP